MSEKGEHGFKVVLWKIDEYQKQNDTTGSLRTTNPFSSAITPCSTSSSAEGIKFPDPAPPIHPIEQCGSIVRSMPHPPAFVQEGQACYRPSIDTVGMPALSAFHSAEEYYSTLFHELTHSTGHPTRLAREGILKHNPFGSEDYSKEELVARWERPCSAE